MTKIEWTNETLNPIIGCSKVSEGCENCYAERMACRLAHMNKRAYQDVTQPNENITWFEQWNSKTAFVPSALDKPLKRKKPTMYFVCSMGDFLHPTVYQSWLHEVLNVVRITPQHTYQFLTKRPERFFEYEWKCAKYGFDYSEKLPDNLWLGVTAENQAMADKRIPILKQIPAAVRFVSVEPMLEGVEIPNTVLRKLDWVIIGAESGPNRRPCRMEWVESVVDQCKAAGVPVFVKQIDVNGKLVKMPPGYPQEFPK